MNIRQALTTDIPQLKEIRMSVTENVLSNPLLIKHEDYEKYMNIRGRGWVAEEDGILIGFAIADLLDHNIWALFVRPQYEARGVGKILHNTMLNWYFEQTNENVWLSTAPHSRAEKFYRLAGWTEEGIYGKGEIKFVMNVIKWQSQQVNLGH